jgi:hypothetical protein
LPALKKGTLFGATSTSFPVFGFLAFLGSLFLRLKLPKFLISTLSPFAREFLIASKTASVIAVICDLVKSELC